MERMFVLFICGLMVGSAAGVAGATVRCRGRSTSLLDQVARIEADLGTARHDLFERQTELADAQARAARLETALEHERRAADEKLSVLDMAQQRLTDTFSALSAQALDRNNRAFLDLAASSFQQVQTEARGDLEQRRQAVEHLVAPLRESLDKVDAKLQGLEVARTQAYASLAEQVRSLGETQERLRSETANLVTALRAPAVRGRWGELQLRRVVELAGMVRYCDFVEQATAVTEDGVRRPDMVVRLPGGKQLVIDAKVPLQAYLEAAEATDDTTRTARLRDHARRVRAHIDALSAKTYWAQFEPSPDFVVLFIPGESFFAAACEQDPGLFEHGSSNRVLLATPTTLIALLQSVAYGWRQEALAENARAVCEVGRELYHRLATMGDHVSAVGRALDRAVDAYNKQVGSLESRVLVSARRLADLEVATGDLPEIDPVEKVTRAPQADELTRRTIRKLNGEEVA